MCSYEKEQQKLQALLEEVFSDEEPYEYSSESYNGSDDEESSSDNNSPPSKRRKSSNKKNIETTSCKDANIGPSTSSSVDSSGGCLSRCTVTDTIEDVIRNLQLHSDSSSDELTPNTNLTDVKWNSITGSNLQEFVFDISSVGIKAYVIQEMQNKEPIDFFFLFIDEYLLNLMVVETNRYAAQKLSKSLLPKSRIKKWKDVDIEEMKVFLGLQMWIGLVQMPRLSCYWSTKVIYSNEVKKVMSRNRFELLLSNWHFSNNESDNISDRLYKLTPIIDKLRVNFQKIIVPGNNICVDETLVPFRGRLSFLQYIKNKRHKFGVKLFKLCIDDGYTYDFRVYCGKEKKDNSASVPTSIVMQLCSDLLDYGRTVYVDNYYTSVELAHKLLDRQTHLVGTARKNRKGLPKDIVEKKLKKGEIIGKESERGVVVIKWCDKREVLMLSTKHTDRMVTVSARNNKEATKPEIVVDYNKSKSFIDLSDQIKAYASCLRKGIKWYRKLAVEILLGGAVVNAHLVYKDVTGKKISITEFREKIVKELLQISEKDDPSNRANGKEKHILEERDSKERRRCVVCYKKLAEEHDWKYAGSKATQTRWRCIQCDKFYCVKCFTIVHYCTI